MSMNQIGIHMLITLSPAKQYKSLKLTNFFQWKEYEKNEWDWYLLPAHSYVFFMQSLFLTSYTILPLASSSS